ncbi:uncharacterized protein BDZ99DRAFT_459218 [Mytilinidion resinicola]|uniref:Uncharacterized protein n=1 Tax=Mytilinidion resinicola TaxID=574789 RepID=A0A6A6Z3I3_9PEZI|nr:uncharacterized protein BDZ99DRAFT_459218 [Mytilinidion resinicola]KAF2815309.1 hypothetical protein BDZ99DRAFT_459218 [Mytilinidion resinicola]
MSEMPGPLPKKYKGAAFRVTAIMCALPIAVVTGYELYGRFFQGKERKILPRIEPLPPAMAAAGVTPTPPPPPAPSPSKEE